jgi:hypothetical protein
VRPVRTKRLRAILVAKGCVLVGTEGSHENWQTPGGLSNTIVAAHKEQSAGLARNLEAVFAPELGPNWLTKELNR